MVVGRAGILARREKAAMTEEVPSSPLRRWLAQPNNKRLLQIVGAVLVIALVTRFNGCDRKRVVRDVMKQMAPDIAGISEKLDAIETLDKNTLEVLRGVDMRTTALYDTTLRPIYRFDPRKQEKPDALSLNRLREAATAGAELRVVHQAAEGVSELVVIDCITVRVDENGNILCTSPVIPANLSLPDGRAYQETIRQDGTLTYAHWNADGSNVQAGRELGKYTSIWLARLPLP
jgi:hypothetical protein